MCNTFLFRNSFVGYNHPTQVEMLHALLHERRGVMQCCVATLDSLAMYETLPLMFDHVKGPYIKDVRKIFWILDPLLPLVRILPRSIVVNLRNLPYYVCFWATPLPPLVCILIRPIRVNPRNLPYYVCFWATPPPGEDILYVWPLT